MALAPFLLYTPACRVLWV